MRFSSLPFLFGFLPITLAIYFAVPLRWRNLALLLTSLVFYGWGEPVYISIMVLSILSDYTHGLLVEKYRSRDKLAQWFVAESVLLNLGLLGFFKYWDFFAANLSLIPGVSIPTLGLPLPIGISFFTFQTMSYTVDVYRQDAPAQRNMVSFGAYVTMFPQLVAGPIAVSYTHLDVYKRQEFIRVVNPSTIKMRVWERGSGEIMASGTGACAAVVALSLIHI